MEYWLNLIGLILGMTGTFIVIKGTLATSAAIIKQRWTSVEESWQKVKPTWFHRIFCHIAKKYGSNNSLDTQDYISEQFITNFWAFILLFFGFFFQLIALLVSMRLLC